MKLTQVQNRLRAMTPQIDINALADNRVDLRVVG